MIKKIKSFVIFILLLTTSCINQSYKAYETIQAKDNKLAFYTTGTGDITVIFESGLGDKYNSWYKTGIVKFISSSANVILYNRSGIDTSETSNNPPNIYNQMDDLRTIISLVPKNNKIILVGHSLGGAIIRAYAINNPKDISALIFIDTSHEIGLQIYTPEDREDYINYLFKRGFSEDDAAVKEARESKNTLKYLKTLGSLPDIPVTVITAKREDNDLENEILWYNSHKNLGIGLSDFIFIEANKSGHYIHQNDPEIVENAILNMINKIEIKDKR